MTEQTNLTLDGLLSEFVHASDIDSGRKLDDLYRSGIDPAAAAILRNKLRVSLRIDDDGYLNQIGLDLLGDVRMSLLPVLRRMREQHAASGIDNLYGYIKAASLNTYRQYLRDKYPNRLRLRNKIRYILTRKSGYAVWNDERGSRVAGKATWQRDDRSPIRQGEVETLREFVVEISDKGNLDDNLRLIELIEAIFDRSPGPLIFEDVVSLVWSGLRLTESQHVDEAEGVWNAIASAERNVEEQLDDRLLLRRLWEGICSMPLRHRRALLLNLTDGRGDNLIAHIPRLGIASIRDIAATLEYEAEDFAHIWSQLPLDDLAIANRMGLTRQQVINLRQSARASLRRRKL